MLKSSRITKVDGPGLRPVQVENKKEFLLITVNLCSEFENKLNWYLFKFIQNPVNELYNLCGTKSCDVHVQFTFESTIKII